MSIIAALGWYSRAAEKGLVVAEARLQRLQTMVTSDSHANRLI